MLVSFESIDFRCVSSGSPSSIPMPKHPVLLLLCLFSLSVVTSACVADNTDTESPSDAEETSAEADLPTNGA